MSEIENLNPEQLLDKLVEISIAKGATGATAVGMSFKEEGIKADEFWRKVQNIKSLILAKIQAG